MEESFKNPTAEFKPRTWYHVMSGNMSKAGVTKDLEAMADAGIGGIILFNVSHFIPKGKVIFNSPEHIEMIAHAAAECERLGLSFGVHNCDGWTSSGGPWVTPENSMKKVVHSEIVVDGGKIDTQLPIPTSRNGFYKDIAVLAYPSFESEIADASTKPVVTSSNIDFDIALATDGRSDEQTVLKSSAGKKAWIQFDYGAPYTIRSLTMSFDKAIADNGKTELLTSNDGVNFTKATDVKLLRMGKKEHGVDERFEGITARYFRLETEVTLELAEISLSSTYPYGEVLSRTSLFKVENYRLPEIGQPNENMVVKKEDIINLTSFLDENGNLQAELPEGKWTIMRFGYTVTGAVNSPASKEGTGLEVDKMSRPAFKSFYEGYVRNVIDVAKLVAPNALQYTEIDSYEVGGQNWTDGYENLFREKFAYDILEFLPIYAGRYVDDAETTQDILWDVRNFNSELMTTNYFDYFTELCHEDGLISYVEPYSFNAAFNELDAARKVDIPMGEFWMHQRFQAGTAVSGGRIYGKKVISAESFSARPEVNWRSHPGFMKLTGDKAWTLGINEFMFHRFAHQANTNVKPGMTMSQWGSHIDRTQTWWDNAGLAWFKYLARGQYLLRQGNPVSDLLIFVGDGSPNSIVDRNHFKPAIPNHINFDCINADALINRISGENGELILPDGVKYNALALFNTKNMTIETIRKINDLAEKGIVIIGQKPEEIGGFNIGSEEKLEFEKLANNIWAKPSTYTTYKWDEIFAENNISTDLKIQGRGDVNYIHRQTSGEEIYFFYNPDSVAQTFNCRFKVSGKIPEVWNQTTGKITRLAMFSETASHTTVPIDLPAEGSVFVVFRESSKNVDPLNSCVANSIIKPEFELNPQNQLQIKVAENGSYTMKFQSGKTTEIVVDDLPGPLYLNQPWLVKFQKFYGFDSTLVFDKLMDWKDHSLEQVKYYSGTATYTSKLNIGEEYFGENKQLELNLGEVSVAAKVFVNGEELSVLWKSPFTIDISKAAKEGENELRIEVTNTWTNRLIGDENYPNETGYDIKMDTMPDWYTNNEAPNLGQRKAFCAYPFYKQGDSLESSGLIGPVQIKIKKVLK
jgi:hypothetical protein